MTTDATTALAALTKASLDRPPGCTDDDRFVAEPNALTDTDRSDMAGKCRACPLLILCLEYATADNPPAGFWAGRSWTHRGPLTPEPARPPEPAPPANPTVLCLECGKPFEAFSDRPGVCSTECKRIRARARQARYNARKRNTTETTA